MIIIHSTACTVHDCPISHDICVEIGLDQPMYTLNENNTVYTRRLRLLAPTGYTGFARPRLRLNGIPGTAGGEL